MNTTLTIKMEKALRNNAQETARELGIPLTTVINALTRQFVRDRKIVLEIDCPFPNHIPNSTTRRAIHEATALVKRTTTKEYADTDTLFSDILGKTWRPKKIKI